jgi:hypothetical protein
MGEQIDLAQYLEFNGVKANIAGDPGQGMCMLNVGRRRREDRMANFIVQGLDRGEVVGALVKIRHLEQCKHAAMKRRDPPGGLPLRLHFEAIKNRLL